MSAVTPLQTASASPDRHRPLPLTHGGVLDALRFLAAFCMVVYHYSFSSPVPLAKIHPLFERGYLATDFFLVVSGYVLGRIYGERVESANIGTGAFFARRAQRLVPAHLIMMGAFVALVALSAIAGIAPQHPEYLNWADFPAEFFLVQAYGVPGGEGWNSPTWTLSALLGCYLLFPVIWRAQARIKSPILVVALAVVFMLVADAISTPFTGRRIYEFYSKLGIIRAIPLFMLGGALARLSEATYIAPRLAVAFTVAGAAALVGLQFAGRFDFLSIVAISVMVTGSGAVPAKHPSKILKTAALVSFAVFITNEFVRFVYVGVLHAATHGRTLPPAEAWASWWFALGLAIVVAVIFHYAVDMPTQRWIKRVRAKGRKPAAAPGLSAEAAA